ncbi:Thioredoxin reductase [Candidatus Hodgkinia cicadicola]|uniref:Thioredoxin reductase n=1 Tax=Candidatus Hodgkinia cicadicola TaxID=573658 RepID=A0A097GZT2_9HYPH|nr:Thioredoxin reductase [Candidatus Hodgkinia cicadicola]AUG34129.1 Thioredoxin reductase [Candidatus Hodgkinia cicadicola]
MVNFEKLIIVGAGPAGLTAGIYAARSMLHPLIIAGPVPGGQLISTTEIENFPGFASKMQGYELMEKMRTQAAKLGARIVADSVEEIDTSELPFHMLTASGKVYVANSIIVATGSEPKTLKLPNEGKLRGSGVSTCATCDGFFYKNKNVAIVGGGNTAATDALYLAKIVKSVTVVCRGNKLTCEKVLEEKLLEHKNIKVLYNSIVVKYITKHSDNTGLRAIQIASPEAKYSIRVEGVFIAIGTTPCSSAFASLEKDPQGYIITKPNSTKTNIIGIFAAGDVNSACYKQAVIAAGSGCIAALELEQFLCT